MNPRLLHFAPSRALQLRAFVLAAALCIVMGAVAGAITSSVPLVWAVAVLGSALAGVHLFVLRPVRITVTQAQVIYRRGYRRREQWVRRLTRFTALPSGRGFAAWTAGDHVSVICARYTASELDLLLRALNADPLTTAPPRQQGAIRRPA